jgi:hypothetical protein
MKSLLSRLLSTFKKIYKFFFIIDLKLIYFFSDTLVGYIFYIFCTFYGFFGCTGDNCRITHSLAAIFVVFMIGLVIQTYVLVKIPFTRHYLENLVSKDFIEKYLGKYTGSAAVVKMTKYLAPALSLVTAEVITANQQSERFLNAAKSTENNFYRDCEKTHRIPSDQDYKTMCRVRDEYIDKAAHSTGIISRGFASGFSSFFSSDQTK